MESMSDFFTTRIEGYEEHMLEHVPGCRSGYRLMAESVPSGAKRLLDLGCGTGLELDEIFRIHPTLHVVGVDLTPAMLDRLRSKHGGRDLHLILGNYLGMDFGESQYDVAVSFQTMHHFTHDEKRRLYARLHRCLAPSGLYIECDYMVAAQAEEDRCFAEKKRILAGADLEEIVHYDTPCTVENQIRLLSESGFACVERIWREENTTMLIACKDASIGTASGSGGRR